MNLANKLTMLRMLMIPLFVICFYLPWESRYTIALVIFVLAFITDALDGQIARRCNQITNFGKFMDPIADKLLTLAALVMLTKTGDISPVATIIILAREFLVSALRMLAANDGTVVAASWLGKVKTVTQFIALTLTLMQLKALPWLGTFAVWIAVFFTLWSGLEYFKAYGHLIDTTK